MKLHYERKPPTAAEYQAALQARYNLVRQESDLRFAALAEMEAVIRLLDPYGAEDRIRFCYEAANRVVGGSDG